MEGGGERVQEGGEWWEEGGEWWEEGGGMEGTLYNTPLSRPYLSLRATLLM